ncbi:unnamed protein product [Owenia fusiformis]|uniref:Uncharacterized protein n=1 Tax=Owenia fusiformis TaxID=6347 RepID=A0A8J1UBG6_OWEFU|nr:unnamed protein product [Owenia fusiformis]
MTEETERQLKMAKLAYTQNNITELKTGVLMLFEQFSTIMGATEKSIECKDMLKRFDNVDHKVWTSIRDKYVHDEFYEYHRGNFTSEELKDPAKVLFDFTNEMHLVKDAVVQKIEDCMNKEYQLNQEIKGLQDDLWKVKNDNTNMQVQKNADRAEMNVSKATTGHYEKLINEKNEQIAQLKRENTVQLWAKEKEKILHDANMKATKLESEILQLKTENLDMKVRMQKKINELEDSNRMMKMKSEMRIGPSKTEKKSETDQLKNKLHYMERDVNKMENELANQQKYYIGISNGLRVDHKKNMEALTANESRCPDVLVMSELKNYQANLEKLYIAVQEGRLNEFRADLPEHYIATNVDVKKSPVKMFSKLYIENTEQTKFQPIKGDISTKKNLREEDESDSDDDDDVGLKKRLNLPDNPTMINKNGSINMINAMKYFPHMSASFIKEQYQQFKLYDEDGNGKLDLTELMAAMTTTIGQQFTPAQIKEAMCEVDRDKDNSLDFHEYLLISSNLIRRQGRSDVFRSALAKEQGKAVSKTCVIQ